MSENVEAKESGKGLIIAAYIIMGISFMALLGSLIDGRTGHIYYSLTNYRRIDLIIVSSFATLIGRNLFNILALIFGLIAWRSKKNIKGKSVTRISIILIILFTIREILPL